MYGLYTPEEGGSMGWDKTLISPSLKFSYPDFHILLKKQINIEGKISSCPIYHRRGSWGEMVSTPCLGVSIRKGIVLSFQGSVSFDRCPCISLTTTGPYGELCTRTSWWRFMRWWPLRVRILFAFINSYNRYGFLRGSECLPSAPLKEVTVFVFLPS